MEVSNPASQIIPLSEWKERETQYVEAMRAITVPMRERRSRGEKHPVDDFLNTYYSFPLGRLERWHPGVGVVLEDDEEHEFKEQFYRRESGVVFADPGKLSDKGRTRITWILRLLELTQARRPNLACHGLHEWAMVYSGADVRHRESAPLRISQAEIDALVSSRPMCCTHFDAFRFFAPDAAAFNKISPTLLTREENEQPGCIHTNMDLYKWAYKCSPWVSSELVRESLDLAMTARKIDMRASPYDLSEYGYGAIAIETPEGRREYEREQHALYLNALPLRAKLIAALRHILDA